jgi:hypothetical protein
MNAKRRFMKRFPYFALFLTMVFSACGNIPGLGPVATATSLPTITPPPTNTPTQTPTATPLPSPTPTETLTPQEQLEREYSHLVPPDEPCVKQPESIMLPDPTQANTEYTELQVRTTDHTNASWMKIPLGPPENQKVREVLVLPVVCRDANKKLFKISVIIGGRDFGENGTNINELYTVSIEQTESGTIFGYGLEVGSAEELVNKILAGQLMFITAVIKPGTGPLRSIVYGGTTNELAKLAVLTAQDSNYTDPLNLLAQTGTALPDDFVILPARIDLVLESK